MITSLPMVNRQTDSDDYLDPIERPIREHEEGEVYLWEPSDGPLPNDKPLRIKGHERLTVQVSPFTEQHIKKRVRCYHRLDNGAKGFLENGGKEPPTYFRPLEILCTEASSSDIAGEAPCVLCELMRQIGDKPELTLPWDPEYIFGRLVPQPRVTVEIGVLAIDGNRVARNSTQFVELDVHQLSWFAPQSVTQEWELYRDPDTFALVLKLTNKPLPQRQVRYRFGKPLIVRARSDEFIRDIADTMLASHFERPEPGRADRLCEIMPGVKLVPSWWSTKTPCRRGFFEKASGWMKQQEVYFNVLDHCNIQMVCGPQSGGLSSFDFDNMVTSERWLRLNTAWGADKAAKVWGKRGCAVLFRLVGEYAPRVFKIRMEETGENVGELRMGNCLQTLSGLHAAGCLYRLKGTFIPEVEFGNIVMHPRWAELTKEEPAPRISRRDRCALNIEKLNFMQDCGQYYNGQCPSCAARNKDTHNDNLRIWKAGWGFKCIAGCSREDLLALVGREDRGQDEDDTDSANSEDHYED